MFTARRAFSSITTSKRVAVVDGCRLPFARSGTIYDDLISYDLMQMAIKGLLTKTALDPKLVDYVITGTVVQEVGASNIAREAALGAGIPIDVPAHTVVQACISSSQAICQGVEKIIAGGADVVVAGGSETFSDVPIRFSPMLRKRLLKLNKAKGLMNMLKVFKGFRLSECVPQAPSIENFHTKEVMGHSSDRLAARFGVTREEQDEYAINAHKTAAKAHKEGKYKHEIVAYKGSKEENGIVKDISLEKLKQLRPSFIRPHGTHTAANSSYLTDGAAATLIMSEEKALELGFKPKALFKNWTFVAVDPFENLLLGPAYGINRVLRDTGLSLSDIDAFEIHEAFAGQVLANLAAMESEEFCKENFGRDVPIGKLDRSKLNTWGGSLSLGHPFGATGSRLVTTAANKLEEEGGKYALIAACADSGLGHACLLERYEK